MEDNGWIDRREKMPTSADGDEQGCIVVWHELQGMMVTGWHQVARNSMLTHWQHTLLPPLVHQMQKRQK